MAGDTLEKLARDFYDIHDRIYGHSAQGPIKLVNLRAVHQSHAVREVSAAAYRPAPGDPRAPTGPLATGWTPGRG
jgi:hypothetical protein